MNKIMIYARQNIVKVGLLLTLFSLLAVSAQAEIYKWVDKDGKVHYGDKPDKNANAQRVQVEPADDAKYIEGFELRKRILKQTEAADQKIQTGRKLAAED
ncbi:MAG: DUF4124 domain-containing protein, partial [Gallionella sp.]